MPSGGGSSGSGGGGTQTVVQQQKTEPWSDLQPFLSDPEFGLYPTARRDVLERPLEFFQNRTFIPFSPETQMGLAGTAGRAMTPPITLPAGAELGRTLSGGYLGAGNPFFQQMMQRVAREVTPRISSQFAQGRRLGSGLHGESQARALADIGGQLAFQNYDQERQRMMQATALAPGLEQAGYQPFQQLMGVGARREDLARQELAEQMQRHAFAQAEPSQRLGVYASLLGQNPTGMGGTSTTTGPGPSGFNPFIGGLGMGMQGLGLLGMFGGLGGLGGGASLAGFGGGLTGAAKLGLLGGFGSSRSFKTDNESVDQAEVLTKLEGVPIETWRYIGEPESARHIGPMAEDFQEMFGLGDGMTISYIDAIGVLMASVKALSEKVRQLENGRA